MREIERMIRSHNFRVWQDEAGDEMRVWHCLTCGRDVYGDHTHIAVTEVRNGIVYDAGSLPNDANVCPWEPTP